jgi:hypothetical protein
VKGEKHNKRGARLGGNEEKGTYEKLEAKIVSQNRLTIGGMASCNVTPNIGKSRCLRVSLQVFLNPFGARDVDGELG